MEIQCPNCFNDNEIELTATLVCKHCDKDISGYSYRKPLISATTALAIGIGGFYAVDRYLLEESRYPLATEYSIMEYCVSGYRNAMSQKRYERKQDACLCALDKTMEEVSYSDFEESESNFLKVFSKMSSKCP